MPSDIQIAQSVEMLPVLQIAQKLNIPEELVEPYGR